jgi:hypothetical protein
MPAHAPILAHNAAPAIDRPTLNLLILYLSPMETVLPMATLL